MSFNKSKKILSKEDYDFFHLNSTVSTMNDVKNYLKKKYKNCVIISDTQSKGRGRRGKKWHSPKGNIYCSISFKNFLPIKNIFLFNVLVAISIQDTFKKFNSKKINFKWPNDLYFENKKFGGIIAETFEVLQHKYIIVGFGINISNYPNLTKYKVTCAKEFSEIQNIPDFMMIFFQILFENLKLLKKGNLDMVMKIYKKSLIFINKQIEVKMIDKSILKGQFITINKDGSLKLKKNNDFINIYNGTIKI